MFPSAVLQDWLRPFIRALREGSSPLLCIIAVLVLTLAFLGILAFLFIKTVRRHVPRRGADVAETRCPTPSSSWSSIRQDPTTPLLSPTASTAGTEQLASSLYGRRSLSQILTSPQSLYPPPIPLPPTSPTHPHAQTEPSPYRPMDGLPTEVLQIILQHFAPRHNASIPDSFLFSPFPLRLVSRKWKSAIDGVPEFWKCLNISLGKSTHDPQIFEWYRLVTENVTNFDNIKIRFPNETRSIDRRLSQHLFGLIVKARAIVVAIPPSLSKECSPSPTFPSSFSQTPMRESVRRQLSHGLEMENLRRVEWHMPGSSFHSQFPKELGLPWSSFFALPWGRLTHVKLCVKMSLHDCLIILEFASSIEKLSLRTVSSHHRDVVYPSPRTNLPHLRSLTIHTEVDLDNLFRSCHMPVLRRLKLELEGREAASNLPRLDVGWQDLTQVSLGIPLRANIVEGVLMKLDAVEKLAIEAKGSWGVGDEAWSLKKHLPFLKSFRLSPDNRATHKMMAHVTHHVLPDSIQNLDAPLIEPITQFSVPNFLGYLRIIKLTKSISSEDFLSILSHALLLDEGEFGVSDGREEDNLPPPTSQPPSPVPFVPPPLIFPRLNDVISNIRSLKLVLKLQRFSGEPLLRALTLPRLVKFDIEASRNSNAGDEFYGLLERSQCPIVHLTSRCHSTDSQAVFRILRLVSKTLRRLEVTNCSVIHGGDSQRYFGKELFDRLVHGEDGGGGDVGGDSDVISISSPPITPVTNRHRRPCRTLCPHLEHFYVWPCTDLQSFRKMVSSRWTANPNCQCKKLEYIGAAFSPGDDWTEVVRAEYVRELRKHRIRADLHGLAENSVVYPTYDLSF